MSSNNKELKTKKREFPVQPFKDKEFALNFFKLMVRTRCLEEKLIKMAKSSDGFFWIGGPGEEAFQTSLGLLVNKGEGIEHDYLHLHYRSNGAILAMGEESISFIRQMRSVETDPFSGGRNFVAHCSKKEWNIVPITSTIGTQFSVAPGTARAQMKANREGKKTGISIVLGGDAGTAEGDFSTCLVWSSRPGNELPLLMIVTNNEYGISTPAKTQHGEKHIADRAKAYGIKSNVADGNSPEKAWSALKDAMDYVRDTQKPFLLEMKVSRLNGHSSSSGANRIEGEEDCIEIFARKLEKNNWLSKEQASVIWEEALNEMNEAHAQVRQEKYPDPSTIYDHVFK
ncbi:MAG: thiamine pyrophosphate-dependent dehydrogenase E1 component subunit alpha [Bdellovibrionota bacterium]